MFALLAATGGELNAETHIQRHALFGFFNNHLLMSLVASAIALGVMILVARAMQPRPEEGAKGYVTRSRFGGFFELILVYLRDEAVRPLLHEKTDKYIGFLWSLFFFILFGNLVGMLPIGPIAGLLGGNSHLGGTFTGNWSFTIALAVIACLVWLFAGLKEGGMGYIKHYWVVPLEGQPVALWPLLIIVGIIIAVLEVAGNVLIKPFALSVRLLANMMAGHLVLGSILIISVTAFKDGSYAGGAVAFLGSLAISFLELFVAFLQAYIFMFLTAIFISLGMPHEHDHEHEGHDEHGHELIDGPHGMNPPKGQETPATT
ncbi:MAG: F0F1 ATP synthase subunit A [Phycisphaerales bacterium JB063]